MAGVYPDCNAPAVRTTCGPNRGCHPPAQVRGRAACMLCSGHSVGSLKERLPAPYKEDVLPLMWVERSFDHPFTRRPSVRALYVLLRNGLYKSRAVKPPIKYIKRFPSYHPHISCKIFFLWIYSCSIGVIRL